MEKLNSRDDVIQAVEALQLAEKSFHQANAAVRQARSTASATATLEARGDYESAVEHLLTAASEAEGALAGYRRQTDSDYHNSIQDSTVESRRLHARRQELEQQMADLQREIAAVEQREKPLVDAAFAAQQTAAMFTSNWLGVVSDVVKLTQQQAA